MTRRHRLGVSPALVLAGWALAAPASGAEPLPDGLHATPSVYWKSGDHRVDLGLEVRFRQEAWSAFSEDTVWMNGTRTRVSARYSWRDCIALYAQFQDVRLHGMWPDSTGAALLYRNANDGRDRAHGDALRQLYLDVRPTESTSLRAGRQDVRLGRQTSYPEPDWTYLKNARVGERLVGTVGWSQVERSYDGFSGGLDQGEHSLYAFAVRPTTGVFDAETGYRDQEHIQLGGLAWTLKRGAGIDHTEVSLFGIGYEDDRPTDEGGLPKKVELGTLGASIVGIYPVGPGKLDAMLWTAGQFGTYNGLDHRAAAVLAEVGYQLADVPFQPWFRVGVNYASGDADPGDGDHTTFFNLLPTNHQYYGFADQIALQNIIDTFVQLRAQPFSMLTLNLFVHWFKLANSNDAKYAGTGAYDKRVFGFTATPSRGYAHVGTEYDVVATLQPHKAVTLEAGFAWLDGGSLYRHSPSRDLQWGYASIELKY